MLHIREKAYLGQYIVISCIILTCVQLRLKRLEVGVHDAAVSNQVLTRVLQHKTPNSRKEEQKKKRKNNFGSHEQSGTGL